MKNLSKRRNSLGSALEMGVTIGVIIANPLMLIAVILVLVVATSEGDAIMGSLMLIAILGFPLINLTALIPRADDSAWGFVEYGILFIAPPLQFAILGAGIAFLFWWRNRGGTYVSEFHLPDEHCQSEMPTTMTRGKYLTIGVLMPIVGFVVFLVVGAVLRTSDILIHRNGLVAMTFAAVTAAAAYVLAFLAPSVAAFGFSRIGKPAIVISVWWYAAAICVGTTAPIVLALSGHTGISGASLIVTMIFLTLTSIGISIAWLYRLAPKGVVNDESRPVTFGRVFASINAVACLSSAIATDAAFSSLVLYSADTVLVHGIFIIMIAVFSPAPYAIMVGLRAWMRVARM